jgi:peptidylprolyl isomerase
MGEAAYTASLAEWQAVNAERDRERQDRDAAAPLVQTSEVEPYPQWMSRDAYAPWVNFYHGWPVATSGAVIPQMWWPVHCYGMVGVGRDLSPNTGSGAELYVVNGHATRQLDRNIALVGRVIEGMEHLSTLPRGTEALGFYATPAERTTITSIRLASALAEDEQPRFEYLSTDSASFARYAHVRANRRDEFYIQPAGSVDICNIPVPVRRVVAAPSR